MRGGQRWRSESGVTAASWANAADSSVITWSHTEGAGRRGCKINTMEAMQEANPPESCFSIRVSLSLLGSVVTIKDGEKI